MIGERLEEARKRKGVSIREVAEATKIRGDFLRSMEENRFDIGLPTIYVRGFLKNYARYLKLDPARILSDYDAHQLGRAVAAPANGRGRDALGHVEIPRPDAPKTGAAESRPQTDRMVVTAAPEDDQPEPRVQVRIAGGSSVRRGSSSRRVRDEADDSSWSENRDLYIKIGVVSAGVLLVGLLLVVLFRLVSGSGDTPALNPELATSAATTQQQSARPAATRQPQAETLTFTASDNVTLIIEHVSDRSRLYSGTLNAGQVISIERTGPVAVRFTNGSAISINRNGESLRLGESGGVGRTVIE